MKQLIKLLSIKLGQIFFPVFLIMLALAIAVAPIILTAVLMKGWVMVGILVTIPLGVALLATVNNITNWYTVWDFDDIEEAIKVYKTRAPYNDEHSTPD